MTGSDSQEEAAAGGDSVAPPAGSSAVPPTEYSEAAAARKGERAEAAAAVKGEFFVVDVDWEAEEAEEAERVCRICHLSSEKDGSEEESELIQLGCGCKGELGFGHRQCAETWFRVKGNRSCEICGMNAKNIIGEEGITVEWHEGRTLGGTGSNNNRSAPERESCWKSQPFCNFLMACLVVAFIFPWFFRVNIF